MCKPSRHLGLVLLILSVILAPGTAIHTQAATAGSARMASTRLARSTTLRPYLVRSAAGGSVAIGYDAFPAGLNPDYIVQNAAAALNSLLYASLVTLDLQTKLPAPDLARSWNVSPDGKTYTFRLRPGLHFSDGSPLTAEDVVFSNRVESAANFWAYIPAVATAVDPLTVRFTLAQRDALYLSQIGWIGLPIVSKKAMAHIPLADWAKENWGTDFAIVPVMAGPYAVASVTKGDHYTLTANPYYWRGKPGIQTIIVKGVPSDAGLFSQLQAGDIQATPLLPAYLNAVDRSRYTVYASPGINEDLLILNYAHPYFKDRPTRQALWYAINRVGIIRAVYKGLADLVNSYVSPAIAAYYDPTLPNGYPYNPERAKSLLAAAGWAPGSDGILVRNGVRFAVTLAYKSGDSQLQQVATIIQQNLSTVGINVTLRAWDQSVEFSEAQKGNFDLDLNDIGPGYYPDWSTNYACSQQPPAGANNGRYCNPQLDKLWQAEQAAPDVATARHIFDQLQIAFNQEAVNIFLVAPRDLWVMDARIHGYVEGPYGAPFSARLWSM